MAVKEITPEEAWSGVKPLVEYFRVFGCIGHVYILDVKQTKLDSRSSKYVLLGVSEETKGYKMYNPITKKVMISRDLIFKENKMWNWTESVTNVLLKWGDAENDITKEELEENEDEIKEKKQEQNEAIGVISHSLSRLSSTSTSSVEHNEPNQLVAKNRRMLTGVISSFLSSMSSISLAKNNESNHSAARNRRTPYWMEDYVTDAGLYEEEETQNIVLYTATRDSYTYEEASKS